MDSEALAAWPVDPRIIAFVLVVAAEAGVIVGVRERAMREPAESRLDALRRFYHERQSRSPHWPSLGTSHWSALRPSPCPDRGRRRALVDVLVLTTLGS